MRWLANVGHGVLCAWFLVGGVVRGEEPKAEVVTIAEGGFTLTAPTSWQRVKPKSPIIEYEFAIPASKGDELGGRLTIMGAGGSVEANIDRWMGQFTQPDGSATKDRARVQKRTIASQEVHVVDIPGTYKDAPAGPFAGGKTVEREKYRMLAAVIVTKKDGQATGNYFVKLYGPQQTMADHEKSFQAFVDSLKAK